MKGNNAAYPKAIDELKEKEELFEQVELRQKKYLNNIIEQDHRSRKRLVKPGMGFGSFNTAWAFDKRVRNDEYDAEAN